MLISFLEACSDKPKGDIVHEPGEVVKFDWHDVVPGYSEFTEYLYGFDKDPMGLINPDYFHDVYVSVKNGETAKIFLNLPNNAHSSYSLIDMNSGATVGIWNAVDELPIELSVGKYALYGDGVNIERYVSVIGYDQKYAAGDYYQFDGENGPCPIEEGCYDFETFKNKFDKVYSQVVLNNIFEKKHPSGIGFDNLLEVDMTSPLPNDFFVKQAYKILNFYHPGIYDAYVNYENSVVAYSAYLKENCNLKEDGLTYDCSKNVDETLLTYKEAYSNAQKVFYDYYDLCFGTRVILAINNMRLIWRLNGNIGSGPIVLNNYAEFFAANYQSNNSRVEMYMKSFSDECAGGVGLIPQKIFVTITMLENNKFALSLTKETGESVLFDSDCDYIYVDATAFVPGTIELTSNGYSSAAQITLPISKDGIVDGGVVWAGHQMGEASYNTILHEIGHTFGLSDLTASCDDPSIPCNDYGKMESYITSEANVMNFIVPTGPRLRYRDVQVATTGTGTAIEGSYDNQWECVQNHVKCAKTGGNSNE